MNAQTAITTFVLTLTTLTLGCDPGEEGDEFAAMEFDEDEFDEDEPLDLGPQATDPAEAVAKVHGVAVDLTADDAPVAAAGWLSPISEETPPATCGGGDVVAGLSCAGWFCDDVTLFCSPHGGTADASNWSEWFSEEDNGQKICPGTEWVTGIACKGSWCDQISLECTDLGISAISCYWSGYFGPANQVFTIPAGRILAGVQCKDAYCESKKYFHCSV